MANAPKKSSVAQSSVAQSAVAPPPVASPPAPAIPAAAASEKLLAVPAPSADEYQGVLRDSVEKGLAQGRAVYVKAKVAADESAAAIEASYAAARAAVAAINAKALDTLRANVEANFDFLKSSFGASSVADYVELQGEFARNRIDAASAQAKEFGELAQKFALEASAPIKAQVAKALNLSH